MHVDSWLVKWRRAAGRLPVAMLAAAVWLAPAGVVSAAVGGPGAQGSGEVQGSGSLEGSGVVQGSGELEGSAEVQGSSEVQGSGEVQGSDRPQGWAPELRERHSITAERAAVATAHPRASEIALQVLRDGGNAVDAAIAASYALGVFEPTGSGIGGGGSALVYMKESDTYTYVDFYPRAPLDPRTDFNRDRDTASVKAINIPGLVAGMEYMRERWGQLDRRRHLQPSIDAAREGFVADSVLYSLISRTTGKMSVHPESRALFTDDGRTLPRDFVIRNPALAEVMEIVADEGAPGFYAGALTDTLVARLNRKGGRFTRADFEEFDVRTTRALSSTYRDFEIHSAAPPQSGVLIIQALNMMEQFDFSAHGHYTEDVYPLHVLVEIFKRAYGDRLRYLSDPAFVPMPLQGLLSKEYARQRYMQINHGMAYPRNPRETEVGNPFGIRAGAGSGPTFGRELEAWGDDADDGLYNYDVWADDLFDAWGSPRRDARAALAPAETDSLAGLSDEQVDSLFFHEFFEQHWIRSEMEYFEEEENDFTTHISIIDEQGNMVSLTSTIGLFFGSGVTVNGIIFNSAQSVFSETNAANLVEPGKRGRSTTAPTIVTRDGEPFAILGAAGGGRIPTAILMGLHNMIDHGYDAFDAVAAPRFLARRWHDAHEFESRIDEQVLRRLRGMGHPVDVRRPMEMYFGGMQIIRIAPDGTIEAASDPRRDGAPAGY